MKMLAYRLVALLIVLTALPASVPAEDGDGPRRVFRFNNGADPKSLDPAVITGQPEGQVVSALLEGLVNLHPETLAPIPGVAESWEVSEDGTVYTFHLRACVWSNGDPVTAGDFVYAWKRVLDPLPRSDYVYLLFQIRGARAYAARETEDFGTVGIRAVDDRTLVVELTQPVPYFPELLAFYTFLPVHRGTVEAHGDGWTSPENHVGNGAFRLEYRRANAMIRLAKNPRYHGADDVQLDGVEIHAIEEADQAFRMYEADELDWISAPPLDQIEHLVDREDFRTGDFLATYFYRFNCTRPPFDDPKVRRAFTLAIDRDTIVWYVTQCDEQPAYGFVPEMPGYEPMEAFEYDPDRARELLAEAGYPRGEGLPEVSLLFNMSEAHQQIAVAIQSMWQETLGVRVQLEQQEWKVYLDTTNRIEYDIARAGWIGDYMDPLTFMDMWVTDGGNNRTGWSNADYDRLIAEATRTVDRERRYALFREAESLLLESMPIAPIYYYRTRSLVKPRVRGWYPTRRDIHPLRAIRLAD